MCFCVKHCQYYPQGGYCVYCGNPNVIVTTNVPNWYPFFPPVPMQPYTGDPLGPNTAASGLGESC